MMVAGNAILGMAAKPQELTMKTTLIKEKRKRQYNQLTTPTITKMLD